MSKKKKNKNQGVYAVASRKPFDFVIYLFSEGETEARYLTDLVKNKNVRVVRRGCNSTPWALMQFARKWAFQNRKCINENSSIWVIFDDDEKIDDIAKTVKELENLPKGCKNAAMMPVINIGYMKPCIELWGAMCVLGNANGLSQMHKQMESKLKAIMHGYNHNLNRYFDLRQMCKTKEAIRLAKTWIRQFGDFPTCVGHAAFFAGIAPLVEKIYAVEDCK